MKEITHPCWCASFTVELRDSWAIVISTQAHACLQSTHHRIGVFRRVGYNGFESAAQRLRPTARCRRREQWISIKTRHPCPLIWSVSSSAYLPCLLECYADRVTNHDKARGAPQPGYKWRVALRDLKRLASYAAKGCRAQLLRTAEMLLGVIRDGVSACHIHVRTP